MYQQLLSGPEGQLWMRVARAVYFARAGEQAATLYIHDAAVTTLAATADGRYVASGDQRGEVLVYGMRERCVVGVMRVWGRQVEGLAWDSDGAVLVSLSSDPADPTSPFTEHWSRSGERLALLLHWEWPVEQVWSPNFQAVAWIEDETAAVYYPAEECLVTFALQKFPYLQDSALAWSPDSRWIAVTHDYFTDIWEAGTGALWFSVWNGFRATGIAWPDPFTLVMSAPRGIQPLRWRHWSSGDTRD